MEIAAFCVLAVMALGSETPGYHWQYLYVLIVRISSYDDTVFDEDRNRRN
jgi:hypothetical protein